MEQIEQGLNEMRRALNEHHDSFEALTEKIDRNNQMTASIQSVLETGRALFRLAGWIGMFVKWMAPIVGLTATVWAIATGRALK